MISLKGQHDLQGPVSEEFPLPELPASVCKRSALKNAQALAQGLRAAGGIDDQTMD